MTSKLPIRTIVLSSTRYAQGPAVILGKGLAKVQVGGKWLVGKLVKKVVA